MPRFRLDELAHPIVQAPMGGGPSTPALAAAVSGAGGLGFLAAGYKAPGVVRADIEELRSLALTRDQSPLAAAAASGMIGRRMPAISRFFGITIAMIFDDHGYPHFHARHAAGEAKVRIDRLEVIESTLGRRQLRLVLAWAEIQHDELSENGRRARAGERLNETEPLR
jgi:nitronate monooxygenase